MEHLLTNSFSFFPLMEESCELSFKREGGLGTEGLMRKGSLVSGQALSKRRGQSSLPKASKHTQMYTYLQTQIPSAEARHRAAHITSYLQLSVSRRNQLPSWSSLSVPELMVPRSHQDSSPAASGLRRNPVESLLLLLAA